MVRSLCQRLATDSTNEPLGIFQYREESEFGGPGLPEMVISAIAYRNFTESVLIVWINSNLDMENEEDSQDDLEDQNAAIIRFVNEVVQKAIVDKATDIHFEPHKILHKSRYHPRRGN